ncbi:MAG: hypothetical protein PHP25_02020 [Candidatus Moranbacteria bacterium]|nr:hypothetical protein [Candidatus Moranbacteria bacterium]
MKSETVTSIIMALVFVALLGLFPTIIFIKDAERFRLISEETVYATSDLSHRQQRITLYPEINRLVFDDSRLSIAFEISTAPLEIMKMARGERSVMLKRKSYNSPHIFGYAGRQEIRAYPEIGLVFLFDHETFVGRWNIKDAPEAIQKVISSRNSHKEK